MSDTSPTSVDRILELGGDVYCDDGPAGTLLRVVVDPTTDAVTHLVVRTRPLPPVVVLAPIHLLDRAGHGLRLTCSSAALESMPVAEEERFVSGAPGVWPYHQDQMLFWPFYEGPGAGGMGSGGDLRETPRRLQGSTYDRVAKNEVEVRRGDQVTALDGTIGKVQGLVVDLDDDRVTHVLLAEGHLWGAKQVSIPISAVSDTRHGVTVALTRAQVRDLPAVVVSGIGDHRLTQGPGTRQSRAR